MKINYVRITVFILFSSIYMTGCELLPEKEIIDEGKKIRFVFDDGLNDDPKFRLDKDKNGYYIFNLYTQSQNIQRISVRLLNGDKVVETKCCGKRQKIEWRSNLYWWLKKGETVGNITKTYFNPFTREIQYVNLPPLVNWKDELIPTINENSYTDDVMGRGSTVIGPIGKMKGDTMIVYVNYRHQITKSTKGSMFFSSEGYRDIIDSVKIILK